MYILFDTDNAGIVVFTPNKKPLGFYSKGTAEEFAVEYEQKHDCTVFVMEAGPPDKAYHVIDSYPPDEAIEENYAGEVELDDDLYS